MYPCKYMNNDIKHILTLGLSPEAAEKVIIAYSSFEACENSFPGELALILCNAARVSAMIHQSNIEVLSDAPQRIAKAIEKVNLVAIENQRFVDTTGEQLKRAAWEIREEQTAFAKERAQWKKEKWFWVRLIVGGCAICLASVIYSTVLANNNQRTTQQAVADFKKEAIPLTAKATAIATLQKVIIGRGHLNAEIVRWKDDWETCITDIGSGKPTPEQADIKAKLEETYAALMERRDALEDKERRGMGN